MLCTRIQAYIADYHIAFHIFSSIVLNLAQFKSNRFCCRYKMVNKALKSKKFKFCRSLKFTIVKIDINDDNI